MKEKVQEYNLISTYESGNAIVRVYKPVLPEEELKVRMKRLHNAAVQLVKASLEAERKNQ